MSVGLQSIDMLKLDEAFAKGTSSPFNDCWTVRTDTNLLVVDNNDTGISEFSDNQDDAQHALLIINNKNKEIVLLKIDHKLFDNRPGGIADCAVLNGTCFDFVEFKTNALGNSEQSIRDTFDKAIWQLKITADLFDQRLSSVEVNFRDAVAIRCRVVVSERFPKSTATKQEYKLSFAEDTNGLELSFERKVSL